jgi:hypothetical protein
MVNQETPDHSKEPNPNAAVRGWFSRALDLVPRLEDGEIDKGALWSSDDARRNHPNASEEHSIRFQMEWRARRGLDPGDFEELRSNTSKALDIMPRTEDGEIDMGLLQMADRARRRDPERAEELLLGLEALIALGSVAASGAEVQPPPPPELGA